MVTVGVLLVVSNYHRGEQCNGKLTEREVKDIKIDLDEADRLRRELKRFTCASIADRYGVSEEAIKQIKQGKTWRHV